MMDGFTDAPAAARTHACHGYDEALASVVCARLAEGLSLMEVCRAEGMPSRETVRRWRRDRPAFRARYVAAFQASRANPRGGRRVVWNPAVASLICDRIAAGMGMGEACDLPGLPCPGTVYGWVRSRPDFRAAYEQARMVQAHQRFDEVWEAARAATPATAAVARIRVHAAKWLAARLAPRLYGVRGVGAETEPPDEPVMTQTVTIRKFCAEPGEPDLEDVTWPIIRKRFSSDAKR